MQDRYLRRDPDQLLAQIESAEAEQKRGKLKIFLGYAAGVGKTYAMLEAAQRLKNEKKLVVAYVETHGRKETEALLSGLETIPNKQLQYRGISMAEMDLDAVLALKPELALVDELAHTNAPGSRHPKRYQDVEELLEAGIDVYSTLNIQHLESLRDSVAQITSIWVRESVPDSIIDEASEIELIDLPPDDLLQRLKEGKVYISEQVAQAVANFFRKGNLSALREFSMRVAADRVDDQVKAYMSQQSIRGPWPTAERLMVCITPGRWGNRLLHTARSLASQLNARWTAVHVETPGSINMSSEQQEQLTNLMRQAERLGASVEILHGISVSRTILDYAYKNSITKIIIGKPQDVHLRNLLSRSVANQIVRYSKYIDVYIVSGKGQALEKMEPAIVRFSLKWWGYLISLGLVSLATAIGALFQPWFYPINIIMLYLLTIVTSAVYSGFGPSIMASVLSLLAFDFFFIPPYYTFAIAELHYLFTFAVLLAVGIITSYLTSGIRQQSDAARQRELETGTLYSLSKYLTGTIGLQATIMAIIDSAGEKFKQNAVIFLSDKQKLKLSNPFPDHLADIITENESAVASWTFDHQKAAGSSTDTLPDARALYLPLSTAHGKVGVLGLWPKENENRLTVQHDRLLKAFADLASMAIERSQLAEAASDARILEVSQKLQTALLNSISHDLRTPLVSIIGVLSSLQDEGVQLDDAARTNMVQVALEESERLNHFITNLLDVSKIEAGALRLSLQPAEIQDIIGATLEQIGNRYKERTVKVNIANDLPYVMVDFGLIVQVIVNLLDNALKYSPSASTVEVNAKSSEGRLQIEVADRGIGIPEGELLHVFDKFYRVQRPDNVSGTGLGLSICKGIIEAHNGTVTAQNREGGGTIVRIQLPLTAEKPGVK